MALTEAQKTARTAKRRMTSALKEEVRAHRSETRRQEWRDQGMHLTRDEALAGEPCRGCGLPVIDNLGDWGGTMYLTLEERVEYDAAQDLYQQIHPDCDSHRWSIAGSRATHCGYCCPPLPMSEKHAEDIRRLLDSLGKPRPEELDIWTRTLTCGHQVQQSVHHTNREPSFSTQWCPECELTRGVVSSKKARDAASRVVEAQKAREDELAQAEREVAKADKAAREARHRLDELRSDAK